MTVTEKLEQKVVNYGKHNEDDNSLDEEIGKMHNAITERIQKRTPPCPIDGQKSLYVRMQGWRGAALYKCPKGHEFSMLEDQVKIVKG
ncbi:MAG: hypothetical protein UV56_C0013G0002 [Candidatus Woesebacteria bacterium GW2011_GWC1_43_10b]|uniref:Uncharacterized protein n=2 Tax=Candidatus Woeseibacteriota TaxID=1752722 RepID=A0A0G1GCT6_9BACT|nr:MAG: hypothetical protein UV56_C0013G0002 [Candidatus Woesebacteria bacterium GW2011_GWC1_43_10b]KKT32345.1 MAG: hypothetical protein UW21_C0026G0006 [Candidatus Woesebacteria bacterium GW2011_GWB1_44_11b]